MKKLSCIIVDDEPVARKVLREFAEQVAFLELKGEFQNAVKMEAWLQAAATDLIFLDIEMPKRSGLEYLKKSSLRPMIILTTAYPEYALQGYELDIIDYLLKPIAFSRFQKAVQKAKDFTDIKAAGSNASSSWLFVRSDKRIEKVEFDDIVYIESAGNYINIHTKERNIIAYLTLKGIESELPSSGFIKIHQSFIVSFSRLEAIEGNQVKVNNKLLPIGRSYRDTFMKMIEERLVKR